MVNYLVRTLTCQHQTTTVMHYSQIKHKVMKTIITNRHWKGYHYGNPWESKAIDLYTKLSVLFEAVKLGLITYHTEEYGENGFIYGQYHIFTDAEGVLLERKQDNTFGLNTWDDVFVSRDFKPFETK